MSESSLTTSFPSNAANESNATQNESSSTNGNVAPSQSSLFGISQLQPTNSFGSSGQYSSSSKSTFGSAPQTLFGSNLYSTRQANPFGLPNPVYQTSVFAPLFTVPAYTVTTVFDNDYGECLQFDLSKLEDMIMPLNAAPVLLPTISSRTLQPTQMAWRAQLETFEKSFGSDGTVKRIIRIFLCNPEHTTNNVTVKLTMCLVHKRPTCSCEDMESHAINYNQVPVGKGHGFEWQYNLNKFKQLFSFNGKLTFRIRIALVTSKESSCFKNAQVISNYEESQLSDTKQSVMLNYVNLIDSEDADFVISLECNRHIRVHKLILKAQWPSFAKTLPSLTENVLVIKGHSYDTMIIIVKYLYGGILEITSVENGVNVFHAANAFELLQLASETVHFVTKKLSLETLFDVLIVADMFNYEQLKTACFSLLMNEKRRQPQKKLDEYPNYQKLLTYPNFNNLLTEILTTLFNVSI